MDNTTQLITQCLSGNKEAWDEFVDDYSRWIYHCILRTAHGYGRRISTEDTDELSQDVFVILLDKGLKQFRGESKPYLLSYLRRIAICHTINYLKKCNRYVGLDDIRLENGSYSQLIKDMELTYPPNELERLDTLDQLKDLLTQLSADERSIVVMSYFDQLSPKEIAEKLLITVDTYYVRKNRVLSKLKIYAVNNQMSSTGHEEEHE